MSDIYPFRIESIFFEEVHLSRTAEVEIEPDSFQLRSEIGLGLPDEKNKIQVHFRVRTPDDIKAKLEVDIVCIALADYLEDDELSDEVFAKYVNEHLLIAMSSRIIQFLATVTTQMGMPPIWLPPPRGFELPVDELSNLKNSLIHGTEIEE